MCEARPWGAAASPAHAETCRACSASERSRPAWRLGRAPWRDPSGWSFLVDGIQRLLFVLDLAIAVRRERRFLLTMDDHALKDIGFNRNDACAEARRSLWDIPRDRLWL